MANNEIEFIFDVAPDSSISIEVKGAEGRSCLQETAEIEKKLGVVIDREMKPESRLSVKSKATNQNRLHH